MKRPESKEEVEQVYDAFARTHDIDEYYEGSSPIIRFIEGRRLATIRRLVDPKAGQRILEVGCGGGHVLRRFPEARLTGVDVSGEMLAKARRNLAGLDADLRKGDIADVGLEDGSFDAVVCTEVLEHVVDPHHVLRNLRRLVAPDGRVVITFPNDRLINGLKSTLRRAGFARLPPFRRVDWGGDHYHFHVWSIPEMRGLVSRYFSVVAEHHAPSSALPIRCCFLGVPRAL